MSKQFAKQIHEAKHVSEMSHFFPKELLESFQTFRIFPKKYQKKCFFSEKNCLKRSQKCPRKFRLLSCFTKFSKKLKRFPKKSRQNIQNISNCSKRNAKKSKNFPQKISPTKFSRNYLRCIKKVFKKFPNISQIWFQISQKRINKVKSCPGISLKLPKVSQKVSNTYPKVFQNSPHVSKSF